MNDFKSVDLPEPLPNDLFIWSVDGGVSSLDITLKKLGIDNEYLNITFDGVMGYRVMQDTTRARSV